MWLVVDLAGSPELPLCMSGTDAATTTGGNKSSEEVGGKGDEARWAGKKLVTSLNDFI